MFFISFLQSKYKFLLNLQRLFRRITDLEDLKEKVANLTNITMTQQVMILEHDVAITTMEDMYTSKF